MKSGILDQSQNIEKLQARQPLIKSAISELSSRGSQVVVLLQFKSGLEFSSVFPFCLPHFLNYFSSGGGMLLYFCDMQWCKMSGMICRVHALFRTISSSFFLSFFLPRGNIEEEDTLKTNKYVYSLLLRSVANKNLTLLERIEVILNLLEQLTQGSEGKNLGIQ